MSKFTDAISIRIRSGKGGAGSAAFRREKYIPNGGPDGGDGGNGGDVYFVGSCHYYNLSHFDHNRVYKAKNGQPGLGRKQHGAKGEDLFIKVPLGTEILNRETGEKIIDIIEEDVPVKVVEGGIGGRGNVHFKSSTNQAPEYAQPGRPGVEIEVELNLKLIADVGLVGLPNAGKSTLLSTITNAEPKIANYPFTTLIPNLGVVKSDDGRIFKIADIPGIIEGAHHGQGLGLSFLQHIERVKVLLYLIDISDNDPLYTYELLSNELATYNKVLNHKPSLIVLTKADLADEEIIEYTENLFKDHEVMTISSMENINLNELIERVNKILTKID